MAHNHHHSHNHHSGRQNISLAFWVNSGFALLELVGGFYTNSVAIMSDALHDFGDSLSLGLAYYFQKKSSGTRDAAYSYGYKRFSLLGAILNAMILIIGSVFILEEALKRIADPEPAHAQGMFVLALLGVGVNTFAMLRLRRGASISERVVSLHFLEDVLGWVAVLIGSMVMMFVSVPVLDPILSVAIAGYILFNVYKSLRQATRIILQRIPENVDIEAIEKIIRSVPGVAGVHDLHTWSMDGQYNIMTVHVAIRPTSFEQSNHLKKEIRQKLSTMNIQHLTVETELEGDPCAFKEC
jgi:cobalt-zinc-cadmium efflux system protein